MYTLILTLVLLAQNGQPIDSSMATVSGFKSQTACQEAGTQWKAWQVQEIGEENVTAVAVCSQVRFPPKRRR